MMMESKFSVSIKTQDSFNKNFTAFGIVRKRGIKENVLININSIDLIIFGLYINTYKECIHMESPPFKED